MSKTIRITTTPNGGDKYIKIKLEQDFDFLEVLSLNINQEDVYKRFSSDYGVIVGRVIINGGFGVPNAKVSVFIPLDDIDKNDVLKKGLYPYEKISDKNSDGIRYNLLTQDSDSQNDCFTPIGTFPTKREVLDNDAMLEVYCKYYKFTTTTNYAGDFMIFGVPLGTYNVHLDADISDIGIASQRPYDMISKGASISRFDSTTKFSSGTNLDKLVQIKSLDSGVNVQPFWGDIESYEIGITRLDLDLNYDITPAAIFMGSIFGDHGKNSINKNCRPRKALGQMREQITGEGTIRMIRKTIDNKIEEFNVDGSELIDANGAWAYQIPMNLDYMVTDENGNLILSQDPNKGIPTRARVRFNIGLNDTGGSGRLRTRARYLVPNNPKIRDDIDYEFGNNTSDKSFRDLSWNKIYTVSNFITRFQSDNGWTPALTRATTGIKEVDGGDGNKTSFPFNKLNTETNPLFIILCLIITIIINIVALINNIIIGGINALITTINTFSTIRVKYLFSLKLFDPIKCIKCITIDCGDTSDKYAPGCSGCGVPDNTYSTDKRDLIKCFLFQLAKILNIFQFDFYNDWINGSLYAFLLKYKKKRNKKEKFCEYSCDDSTGSGNGCHSSIILDTGISIGNSNVQNQYKGVHLNEGLIKKYNNEFYYAATDKSSNIKLFSTELVNLGSVFECDWQGIPKIQELLIPTTYKLPPDSVEFDDNHIAEVTGMVNIAGCGLFFDIDCIGLHSNATQMLNIRHICEMSVNQDEAIEIVGGASILPDCNIGFSDIDELNGKWFRDVFLGLNNSNTPWSGIHSLTLPYTSEFNLNNSGNYDFVATSNNGVDYINFRNYTFNHGLANKEQFGQPDHSYYFYFGIQPGSTSLDKMNKKFFASCIKSVRNDIVIESNSIPDILNNGTGSIIFSFIGGIGPFKYTITGLNNPQGNPLNITPILGEVNSSNTQINNLFAGTYLISAVDASGTIVTDTISINGPTPLYCFVNVSSMLSHDDTTDGSITIVNVGGGNGTLRYILKKSDGTTVNTDFATSNLIINGLGSDSIGYSLTVYDESIPRQECITNNLIMTGPSILNLTYIVKNIHCYGGDNGEIKINVVGGSSPYSISTSGPLGYTSFESNMPYLSPGQYTVTVVDSLGASLLPTTINVIEENPKMVIEKPLISEVERQCDPNNYNIPLDITSGISSGNVKLQYTLDDGVSWIDYPPLPYALNNRYVITLPKDTITADYGIAIRFWLDSTPQIGVLPCYSEEIYYYITEMTLPLVAMTKIITTNGPDDNDNYTYTLTVNGGVAPLTLPGFGTISSGIGYSITSPYNNTVTDANGCTLNITN